MKTIIEKTDTELKTDVLSELKYEPSVKVTDIGVLVQDGTVTLNGYATSYMEKGEAVRAAKRVAGGKAIADDMSVAEALGISKFCGTKRRLGQPMLTIPNGVSIGR